MFFVMRKRHIALFLSAASCLVILVAIWWESGPPEAAETMGSGPSAAPARVIVIDAGHGTGDPGNTGGGVNEADVWKKIAELNALYEAALSAERARYDALLKEQRDRTEPAAYGRAGDEAYPE